MSTLSDAQHFRRMLAGTCMIAAPLVLLASAIVAPSMSSTKEGPTLQAIADHQGRFYLSTVLLIVGLVLLVPAVLGLMHILRERRGGPGPVGGGVAAGGGLS